MTAWLDLAPKAFDRTAKATAPALFGRDEAAGLEGELFDILGEPVADALAPHAERAALVAERAALVARLAEIDALLI